MKRRRFLGAMAAAAVYRPPALRAAPFPVKLRKALPYESLYRYIEPGHDEFPGEKHAADIGAILRRLPATGELPLAADFQGISPLAARYTHAGEGVEVAVFDRANLRFREGLAAWLQSLGEIRAARFFVLPGNAVRYEVASADGHVLRYRVGLWKQEWSGGKLKRFEPVEETLTESKPFFRDITGFAFGGVDSFDRQLRRGVPYWRARLDSACGIDVYGNNGVAVGDIDGDGFDEIYVCQPGGLPNRLYKNTGQGRFEDITERAGVGVLDDTASALFVDLRNSGLEDLIVLRGAGPLVFLNQGDGRFAHREDAFRFATAPQGTFTGMAAADYNRDGLVDVYLCCYVYFQSEDQYHYPVPYYDAQNGPPSFLFRNRGDGSLDDVTAETGLNIANNRFSFAAAWCDYDGDGWPDLYVANDFGKKKLYKNERGHFRDVAAEAGVEDIGAGMSAAWFDYDGDGRPDLYVSNMWSDAGQRATREKEFVPREAYRRHAKGNSLFRNRGDGTFEETGAAEGVEMGRWAWGADGIDFDNDGSPEILVAAGMLTNSSEKDVASFFWRQVVARSPGSAQPAPAYENGWNAINQLIREDYSWCGREPNVFYAWRGGRYRDFSGASGFDFAEDSRTFASTDVDGDGNLDLILKNRMGPQLRVLRNECGVGRGAIAFRLAGTKSNRGAIGARVDVDGQVKFVQAGSGYLAQHTKQLHFGLGEAGVAKRVRIQWPSGATQEFTGLAAGSRYDITEGLATPKKTPFRRREAIESPAVEGDNQPKNADTWLLEPAPLPVKAPGPGVVKVSADLPAESLAGFALFRRYLFDWRSELEVPMWVLVDGHGMARKVYFADPAGTATADRNLLASNRDRLALPFPGKYYSLPHRNTFRLGAAFYWAGYPEMALPYLEETVRRNPVNAKALLAIGQIHLEAGRFEQARPYLERSLAINASPEAYNELGGVEMGLGRTSAAIDYYRSALALRDDIPYLLVNAGEAYAKAGNDAEAERLLRRAIAIDPADADADNQLGLLCARSGRTGEARDLFQKAIAARRDHPGAINNLGVLYMQLGQTNDALAAFEYGLKVAPDDDELYMNLGRVYVRLGNRERARDTIERLLARKPDSVLARRALAELESR